MTDPRTDALNLAILRVLAARLKTAGDMTNEAVNQGWEVGDRTIAVLPSGDRIGQVTLTKGVTTARVSRDAEFVEWVKANYPSEIQTIEQVNPAFKARVLKAAKDLGAPIDATTGEEVPGLAVGVGTPYPMVKLDAGAEEMVEAAWQSGDLMELVGSLLRRAVEAGEPS